jgi:D-alanyl-D-alanine carboxypeptidase
MNMKLVYHYALHAVALSAVLSIAAILPAAAQQDGHVTTDGAKPHAAADIPSDEELASTVDQIVAQWMSKPAAVGLSVAVARGDKFIVAKGYGKADLEFNVPADADTMFRMGSVTKQYTAAAMMKLIEDGMIILDDELTKFLPDFPMQGHTVTVKQLLNHTSGIKSYTSIEAVMSRGYCNNTSHEEVLSWFKDEPFDFEPGAKWKYNNSGYYLLGLIIEKASGKPYGEYLQEAFFTPLGLKRTRMDSVNEVIANRAEGYQLNDDGAFAHDQAVEPSIPYSAGALIASAKDMVRWQQALHGGKVVSADSYRQMTTPTVLADGDNPGYGYGLELDAFEGRPCIQHGGGIFGFNSTLMYFPKEDLHVGVISNSERLSSKKVAREIVLAAFGIERVQAQDVAIAEEEFKPFTGHFKFERIPFEADFMWVDGKPHVQGTGQPALKLLYQGGNEFRAEFDNDVRFIFSDDRQSFMLHQNGAEQPAKRAE